MDLQQGGGKEEQPKEDKSWTANTRLSALIKLSTAQVTNFQPAIDVQALAQDF